MRECVTVSVIAHSAFCHHANRYALTHGVTQIRTLLKTSDACVCASLRACVRTCVRVCACIPYTTNIVYNQTLSLVRVILLEILKKSLIKGRGNCFACEASWQLFRSRESRAKQLSRLLISDFSVNFEQNCACDVALGKY